MRGTPTKGLALRIWTGSGLLAAGATLAHLVGFLPLLAAQGILILAFPAFAVFLFLWWSAREGVEDIPFMGY
ncbi:MAG: hypothetical protein LUQ32_06460 [Methanomicrobiales archaeon]|nr:hypothetical protein [Methanomicrobiales archaeon]